MNVCHKYADKEYTTIYQTHANDRQNTVKVGINRCTRTVNDEGPKEPYIMNNAVPTSDNNVECVESKSKNSPNGRRGFSIEKTSSGSCKAVLETGLDPEEAECALNRLVENDDIKHLDISAFPLNNTAASQNHDQLAKVLLPFALKPTIVNIILPVNIRKHCLEGACRGIFTETIRRAAGVNRIDVLGTEVKLSCLANTDEILSKFAVVGDAIGTSEMKTTCDVLTRVGTMTNIPHALGNAVVRAAKRVRARRRQGHRNINPSSSCDPDITETPTREAPHCDEDHDVHDEKEAIFIPRQVASSLGRKKRCYVCKGLFSYPSSVVKMDRCRNQYPSMCHTCASQNLAKRNQRSDLRGKYAVVTGGRIKIGYHVVLKLLRDGCDVITTTRFPMNAAGRFQEESDFLTFKDRLKIYQMDLKNLNSVYAFIAYVERTFPHLDILINNAAQTIRRPQQFFDHMLPQENQLSNSLPEHTKLILADELTEQGLHTGNKSGTIITGVPQKERTGYVNDAVIDSKCSHADGRQYEPTAKRKRKLSDSLDDPPEIPSAYHERCSDNLGQTECSKNLNSPVDLTCSLSSNSPASTSALATYFPPGMTDGDGQQLDLRPENSWILGLEQVPLSELLEVLAINSVAPFILVQRLKTQLDKSPALRRFVVNVSAMEGQFSRANKSHFHPHTNMAKAALNMLTRTAGVGFAEQGVYMTAVDTGWVTDENPYTEAKRREEAGFILPLDVVDGAARVYDPVVSGYSDEVKKPYSAVFLKDYKPFPW